MRRWHIVVIDILLVLSFLLPKAVWANLTKATVNFYCAQGAMYEMRWGNTEPEASDLVPLPPYLIMESSGSTNSAPGCYRKGTRPDVEVKVEWTSPPPPPPGNIERGFRLKLFMHRWNPFGFPRIYDDLWSYDSGLVYPISNGSAYMLHPPAAFPGTVERAMIGTTVELWWHMVGNPTWTLEGSFTSQFHCVLVYDAPQSPMAKPWWTVLNHATCWAKGESTSDGVANALAQKLWENGTYNGGSLAYTRYICDSQGHIGYDSGEVFYLKAFLSDYRRPWGQCNDFADFLTCLYTAVGVFPALAQRTHPLGSGYFHTQTIDPAGSLPALVADWNYHQFCLYNSNVWDGSLSFVSGSPPGVPKKLARDMTYKNGLVAYYYSGQWQPTPTNGFVPTLTTANPPPAPPPNYQEPGCNRGCGGNGPNCPWGL